MFNASMLNAQYSIRERAGGGTTTKRGLGSASFSPILARSHPPLPDILFYKS